jgi:hypothetical protein
MLADIYGWFTGGFDLKDAQALLDELVGWRASVYLRKIVHLHHPPGSVVRGISEALFKAGFSRNSYNRVDSQGIEGRPL